MALTLKGRTVIVTGAGCEIGRGYALELGERGANVIVNDLGTTVDGTGADSTIAAEVADEIRKAGGQALPSGHDAASRDGTHALVDLAIRTFGSIDGIVTNAGIYKSGIPFDEIDDELFDRFAAIHSRGSWWLAQAAWPHFKAQLRGRIVFVTSSAGLYGMAGNPAYSLFKAGIIGLTGSLAGEGAAFGIKVNAISPGAFSRMAASSPVDDQGLLDRYREGSPVGAVAPLVTALLCDQTPFSGCILSAGSGRVGSVYVSETRGFKAAPDAVSAESVLENFEQIFDRAGAIAPQTPDEVFAILNAS